MADFQREDDEHIKACYRMVHARVHEWSGRLEEALAALEPPYKGYSAKTKELYLERRRELAANLGP